MPSEVVKESRAQFLKDLVQHYFCLNLYPEIAKKLDFKKIAELINDEQLLMDTLDDEDWVPNS